MNQTINKISFILIICLLFHGCDNKDDYANNIAMVDNVAISKEKFNKELAFYQKFYATLFGDDYLDEKEEGKITNKEQLQNKLLDSMIKDQVMLNDLKEKGIKIDDNEASAIKANLESKLGDKDSLKANIKAVGINDNDFNEILYNDSIRKIHYDYYLSNNDIKDTEVLDFYNKNKKYQRQYKYNVLVFDNENEAKRIAEITNNSEEFNNELDKKVKNFDTLISDFVYEDDPKLEKAKVLEKEKVSEIFKFDNKYMILMINSYNDNENELLIKVKEVYLKDNYDKYLNKLIKKSKIKVFI